MYLKRKVYDQLLDWKNDTVHSTLEVNGARQVGKTYIINKFADENFRHKIYINLFDLSGKQFMECYKKATDWTPGTKRPEQPLHDAFKLFDPDFEDTNDTVIIIDEIQESSEIFNRIREFTRYFQAHFIVTGSYLGRVLEPEFKFSSGDITSIRIYTLSFKEFLEALDDQLFQKYLSLPLDHADDTVPELYDELKNVYDIYRQIGGYPKVVETYLNTKDVEAAQKELVRIIRIFLNESMRYFDDITDISVFTNIFLSICRILLREKKGLDEDSISEELQKLVTKNYSSNLSKATCYRAINWLYHSGIIGFCGKITELDILNFKPGSRCFFMDLGVAYYYLSRTGATVSTIRSIYFIQTFQNTPQICHKSEGGLYIFLFGFHHLSPLHPNSQPAEACLRKSHKIPVLVHFNPNRNPYIPYLHIKAVSTMQSPIIGFNTKPDIISSHRWIINQSTYSFFTHIAFLLKFFVLYK